MRNTVLSFGEFICTILRVIIYHVKKSCFVFVYYVFITYYDGDLPCYCETTLQEGNYDGFISFIRFIIKNMKKKTIKNSHWAFCDIHSYNHIHQTRDPIWQIYCIIHLITFPSSFFKVHSIWKKILLNWGIPCSMLCN